MKMVSMRFLRFTRLERGEIAYFHSLGVSSTLRVSIDIVMSFIHVLDEEPS